MMSQPQLSPSRPGICFGITQWSLDVPGPDMLHRAAALGFAAIHLDVGKPGAETDLADPRVKAAYADAARANGIAISAITVNSLNDYGMTSPAGSKAAEACRRDIRRAIDAASELGVPLVVLPSFEQGEIRTHDNLVRTAAMLQEATAYAHRCPVLVATENTLGFEETLELLDLAGGSNLRVLGDSLNMILWGHDPCTLIRQLAPHFCNQFHVKDGIDGVMGNARLGVGMGRFDEVAATLRAINFTGYIILENEYEMGIEQAAHADLRTLQQAFTALPDRS